MLFHRYGFEIPRIHIHGEEIIGQDESETLY